MIQHHGVFQLKGVVQNYSWGGSAFIPGLIQHDNTDKKPFAEYWLGAHPNYPSQTKEAITLDKIIDANPEAVMGQSVSKKFIRLPYLFKVLDVKQMLSIQVHPDKKSARKEFALENSKGISLKAPERNYKDENHKPELMVALGPFWLLHGFKNEVDINNILERTPELSFLKKVFALQGYKGLYEKVMLMPQEKVNDHLRPLVKRIMPMYEQKKWKKDDENFWAARAAVTYCREDYFDRGIFSIYFFNLLHLKKGEGIFQPEGLPHAYLEGQNVEVMANSDNVLRAGLTEKHIDVPELMKHVHFLPTLPKILSPIGSHTLYDSPAEEFELHHYHLRQGDELSLQTQSAEIFFLMEGRMDIKIERNKIEMKTGDAVFSYSGKNLTAFPRSSVSLFRVTVPVAKI